jgi:hypothetical protein
MGNGGAGVTGNDLTDSVVVRNLSGTDSTGLIQGSYISENLGNGVSGGTLASSCVLGHPGVGGAHCQSVSNTWIANNSGGGLLSPLNVDFSGILNNGGTGVKNAGSVHGSILQGNGFLSGYDYEESRLSTEVLEVDVTQNYWGPETTAFMDAYPWGSFANVPEIFDFVDNTNLTVARYEDHLPTISGAGPDLLPPAFLLSATPSLAEPVNVGPVTFELVFSEPMDTSIEPSVTFDTIDPFTTHVVQPVGWIPSGGPSNTWRGAFAIGIGTGDGLNTIRVSGARSADGFNIPDDTAHRFVIDTAGGPAAVNARLISKTLDSVSFEWDPRVPNLVLSNIRRAVGNSTDFQFVGSVSPGTTQFTDSGLMADTEYKYQVVEVDSGLNGVELNNPLTVLTDAAPTPTVTATPSVTPTFTITASPSPTLTSSPTGTATPTPSSVSLPPTSTRTATPTQTPTPTGTPTTSTTPTATDPSPTATNTPDLDGNEDEEIDSRDLLLSLGQIRDKSEDPLVLFNFAHSWNRN